MSDDALKFELNWNIQDNLVVTIIKDNMRETRRRCLVM